MARGAVRPIRNVWSDLDLNSDPASLKLEMHSILANSSDSKIYPSSLTDPSFDDNIVHNRVAQ